jgi:hypothetical protein
MVRHNTSGSCSGSILFRSGYLLLSTDTKLSSLQCNSGSRLLATQGHGAERIKRCRATTMLRFHHRTGGRLDDSTSVGPQAWRRTMNDEPSGVAPTTDSGADYAPADRTVTDDMRGAANVAIPAIEDQGRGSGDQPAPTGPIQVVAPEDQPTREPGGTTMSLAGQSNTAGYFDCHRIPRRRLRRRRWQLSRDRLVEHPAE